MGNKSGKTPYTDVQSQSAEKSFHSVSNSDSDNDDYYTPPNSPTNSPMATTPPITTNALPSQSPTTIDPDIAGQTDSDGYCTPLELSPVVAMHPPVHACITPPSPPTNQLSHSGPSTDSLPNSPAHHIDHRSKAQQEEYGAHTSEISLDNAASIEPGKSKSQN